MKILAIRGENLTSLATQFDIDFTQPPLSDAGFFAITGPTGSGKSTILDALCLALYHRVPRLPSHNLEALSDEAKKKFGQPSDVRTLLRRGAGNGFAEVDFRGEDGKEYRARWSVRRARNNPSGNLQNAEAQLIELEGGAIISAKVTEVREEIEARLGLNFEQFRRSVLLAQGDFATFLQSKADERASVLERMTGTEIYTKISTAVFQKNKSLVGDLDKSRAALGEVLPLDAEQRAELETEVVTSQELLQTQRETQENFKKSQRWFAQEAVEQQQLKALLQTQATIEQQWQQHGVALQAECQQVERVQPLRAEFIQRDKDAAQADKFSTRAKDVEADVGSINALIIRLNQTLEKAQHEAQQATQAQLDSRPLLNQTREMDAQIRPLQADLLKQQQGCSSLQQDLAESQEALQREQQSYQQEQNSAAANQQWLDQHESDKPLLDNWLHWRSALARAVKARNAVEQGQIGLTQLAEERQAKVQQQAELQSAQAILQQQLNDKANELTPLRQQFSQAALEAAESELNTLEQSRQQWQQAFKIAQPASLAEQQLIQTQQSLVEQQAGLDSSTAQRATCEQRALSLQASSAALQQHIEPMTLTESDQATWLRDKLQAGEPCMVCGSREHDLPNLVDSPLSQKLRELEQQAEQLEEQRQQNDREFSQAVAAISHSEKQLQQLQQQCQKTQQIVGDYLEQWQAQDALSAFDTTLGWQAVLAEITQQQEHCQQQYQHINTQRNILSQQQRVLDKAEKEQQQRRIDLEAEKAALTTLEHALSLLMVKHDNLTAELQEQQGIVDEGLQSLELVLAHKPLWQDDFRCNAGAFVEDLQQLSEAYDTALHQQHLAQQTLATFNTHVATQQEQCRQLTERLQEQKQRVDHLKARYDDLIASRKSCLGGRVVEEVEQQLELSIKTAQAALDHCQSQLLEQQTQLITRQEARQHIQQQQAELQQQQSVHAAELLTRLTVLALNEVECLRWLQHDEAWLQETRHRLAEMKESAKEIAGRISERQNQLQQLRSEQPLQSAESLEQDLAESAAQLLLVEARYTQLKGQLDGDDQKLGRSQTLTESLREQEAQALRWQQLNEVIGSADGKKFRRFAQSLTLDNLVFHANEHLANLSRRYELRRHADSNLELDIVDNDMGGEARSVYGLSGGESFLVSLALALGLASMSSNSTNIESLFIDEGFGSLDADSLKMAVESLETLQSLGRKVGVISHVPELVENVLPRIVVSPKGQGRSGIEILG